MFITIDDDLNEKLLRIAKKHRRSKRMEVMAALDNYVEMKEFQPLYESEEPAA